MTGSQFQDILNGLSKGWTNRDYRSVTDFFSEDVRYADPLRYSFSGRAALRTFFEADEGREQKTEFHTVIFDEERQIAAVEYTYEGSHRYHGVALVRLRDGLITHWREYQHVDERPWAEFISGTQFPAGREKGPEAPWEGQ